ncbi:TetR/AcrR family transcriptional regulator [Actinomadura rupiterrae]|uniref:TetR/AcrR family transcriptional regulator n=1 Tax=Actinomadura rupiterrae TaxID=559627 RepID=UPI0020A23C0C|nr:TetR/AcrR family transcriptional regulator [Actinomadura rupiterrae]MCP2341034.1 AcrR family transcriptional regulator [Actinomadura rupiterrae]
MVDRPEPIWARPERAAKGPAPSRSRRQIAEAAVALADAEGMEAVSMRKVAAELQVAATALYNYIGSKDELYDLMVDWVEGEDGPPPEPSGQWRTDLSTLAHRVRGSILRHPWMASVAAGRPSFGPNSLAWMEYGLAAMGDLGLDIDEILIANEILQAFVRGFAAREIAERQALQRAGLDAGDWQRALGPYIESVLERGDHPWLARVVRDADVPHAENRQDLTFARGLDRVLDGLLPS